MSRYLTELALRICATKWSAIVRFGDDLFDMALYNFTIIRLQCIFHVLSKPIFTQIFTRILLYCDNSSRKKEFETFLARKKTTKTVLPSCIHNLRLGRRLNVSSTLGTTTMNLVAVSNQQDF